MANDHAIHTFLEPTIIDSWRKGIQHKNMLEILSFFKKFFYFRSSHHQFFLQKEHGMLWCKVPKAASTSWLHAFLSLAKVSDHEIPEDNGLGLHAFLRDKYPLPSKNLARQWGKDMLKFMVVRHPFERIASAYQADVLATLKLLQFWKIIFWIANFNSF